MTGAARVKTLGFISAASAISQGSCPYREEMWDAFERDPDVFFLDGRWTRVPKILKNKPEVA